MNLLSPAAWNGIGVVSFLIVVAVFFVMALLRGWIVLGVHHRELMGQKDREITALEGRSDEDAQSISKFADAAAAATVAGEIQAALIKALRTMAEERTP